MKISLIALAYLFAGGAFLVPTMAQNLVSGEITETVSLGTDEALQIITPEGGSSVIHLIDIRPGVAKYQWRANSATEPESAGEGLINESDQKTLIEGQEIELERNMTADTGIIQIECQQITKDKVTLRYDPARARMKLAKAGEFDHMPLSENQIASIVTLRLDGKERTLTPRDAHQLSRMLVTILKTSNFNSNSTASHKITDAEGIDKAFAELLSRDYLLVTLSAPCKIQTLGGMVPVTKIIIGLNRPDKQYAQELFTTTAGERPTAHAKYAGILCVRLMDEIKKIASLPPRNLP